MKQKGTLTWAWSVVEEKKIVQCKTVRKSYSIPFQSWLKISDEEGSKGGMGLCGGILLWVSWSLFLVTLPFSLLVCFKVINYLHYTLIKISFPKLLPTPSHNYGGCQSLLFCDKWKKAVIKRRRIAFESKNSAGSSIALIIRNFILSIASLS